MDGFVDVVKHLYFVVVFSYVEHTEVDLSVGAASSNLFNVHRTTLPCSVPAWQGYEGLRPRERVLDYIPPLPSPLPTRQLLYSLCE